MRKTCASSENNVAREVAALFLFGSRTDRRGTLRVQFLRVHIDVEFGTLCAVKRDLALATTHFVLHVCTSKSVSIPIKGWLLLLVVCCCCLLLFAPRAQPSESVSKLPLMFRAPEEAAGSLKAVGCGGNGWLFERALPSV